MKKLLVLVLVLAMSSMASALLITMVDDAASDTIYIVSDTGWTSGDSADTGSWQGYIFVREGQLGSLDTPVTYTPTSHADGGNAGELGQLNASTFAGYGAGYQVDTGSAASAVRAGTQHSVHYTLAAGETTVLDFYLSPDHITAGEPYASITVPEPMTIVLLGLGGLFLRRRK